MAAYFYSVLTSITTHLGSAHDVNNQRCQESRSVIGTLNCLLLEKFKIFIEPTSKMDWASSSANSVVKQELILDDDEEAQNSNLDYYSYRSDEEQDPIEPHAFLEQTMDSEETLDADSPAAYPEEGNTTTDSFDFEPGLKRKLAAYSSKVIPGDPWHCTMCPQKYKSEIAMKSHLECHIRMMQGKCSCAKCLMASTKTVYDNHNQRIHPISMPTQDIRDNKMYKCDVCGKDYKSLYSLKQHRSKKHGPKSFEPLGSYGCPECGRICLKTTVYTNHLKTHKQFDNCRIFCDKCRMPLLKGDVERHRHNHKGGRMSAVNGNILWVTREESPDLDDSDTQSIPDELEPTEDFEEPLLRLLQPQQVIEDGERPLPGDPDDIESDLPLYAVMKTNGPPTAVIKEEVILVDDDNEQDTECDGLVDESEALW